MLSARGVILARSKPYLSNLESTLVFSIVRRVESGQKNSLADGEVNRAVLTNHSPDRQSSECGRGH
jgi:hypothetical protein